VAGAGGATIVIVEQSAAVHELIEQALCDSGDRVLVTQNALEVLDVARRVRIDLLVTELESRRTLVGQIRPAQPDLRVLYISTFDEEPPPGPDGAETLRTPFTLDELRAAIAARLDRSEPEG
jgi:DNA-binding response OmpR family regulator